jgi:hypothetical protein
LIPLFFFRLRYEIKALLPYEYEYYSTKLRHLDKQFKVLPSLYTHRTTVEIKLEPETIKQ